MSLGGLGDEDIEDTDISGYFCVAVCGGLGMHLFWMQFKSIFFYMEPNTGLTITDCCSKTTVDSLRRITTHYEHRPYCTNQFTYRIVSHFINKFWEICDVKSCETCNMNIQ